MENLKSQFNIIVYDGTNTEAPQTNWMPQPHWYSEMTGAEPNSLTWWWSLGGVLQTALKNADAVGSAASWSEAIQFVLDAIEKEEQASGQAVPVGVIQFWGHGGPGKAMMAKERMDINSIAEGAPNYDLLQKLKSKLIPGSSAIWFRCCSAFTGTEGKSFACAYRDFFGAKIIAHTYIITALQSGTYILEPGEEPSWSDTEGLDENGNLLYSEPLAPHTITALKFYPPSTW